MFLLDMDENDGDKKLCLIGHRNQLLKELAQSLGVIETLTVARELKQVQRDLLELK